MIDFLKLPSPCYVLDETLLDRNLAVIDRVRRESGAEIIVVLKACAMWSIFPELARHSDGATASSAAEARLVFEEFGRPAHTYAPVFTDRNIEEILRCSDHITFNSVAQFGRFGPMALLRGISCGLRINPQYSPVETDLYNPCVPGSRLGVTADELNDLPAGIDGLHFHVLCESRPHHLKLALEAVEKHFGQYLDRIAEKRSGYISICKSFDAYRAWVIVEAGHYDAIQLPDGTLKKHPRSISFASMDECEFQELYKASLDVLWRWILSRSFNSLQEAENAANQLLSFAG